MVLEFVIFVLFGLDFFCLFSVTGLAELLVDYYKITLTLAAVEKNLSYRLFCARLSSDFSFSFFLNLHFLISFPEKDK